MTTRYLATKTIVAINAQLEADGGAAYRLALKQVLPHIDDAYRGYEPPFRKHLGASLIGRKCRRELWYGFRWATLPKHEGRILRLFNRGHLEEGRVIALLLSIGCQVYQQDSNGKQFRISDCDGHFGGSGDGFVIGIPDLPDPSKVCLSEFKTHNAKSFAKLVDVGVKQAKPEHYIQMQIYMEKFGVNYALYMAVNKDNDELYGEIFVRDPSIANSHIDKANQIIYSKEAPKKLSNSPGWYECKFCNHYGICHLNDKVAENCRTCKFVNIQAAGWFCTLGNGLLTEEEQLKGCTSWSRGI